MDLPIKNGDFPWWIVKLPEGKPPFSYGFPMVFLWFSYGFPMVFLWFSYGFPMVFLLKMVIFHSYLKLPEGIMSNALPPTDWTLSFLTKAPGHLEDHGRGPQGRGPGTGPIRDGSEMLVKRWLNVLRGEKPSLHILGTITIHFVWGSRIAIFFSITKQ